MPVEFQDSTEQYIKVHSPEARVFIYGVEVTDDIIDSLTVTYAMNAPATCSFTLNNNYNKYTWTRQDLGLNDVETDIPFEPVSPTSLEDFTEFKSQSSSRFSFVQTDSGNLPFNYIKSRVYLVKSSAKNISAIDSVSKIPFTPRLNMCCFEEQDPVRIFFRGSLNPAQWYFGFTGMIDLVNNAKSRHQNSVTIECKDILKALESTRTATKLALIRTAATAGEKFEERPSTTLASQGFGNKFSLMTASDILIQIICDGNIRYKKEYSADAVVKSDLVNSTVEIALSEQKLEEQKAALNEATKNNAKPNPAQQAAAALVEATKKQIDQLIAEQAYGSSKVDVVNYEQKAVTPASTWLQVMIANSLIDGKAPISSSVINDIASRLALANNAILSQQVVGIPVVLTANPLLPLEVTSVYIPKYIDSFVSITYQENKRGVGSLYARNISLVGATTSKLAASAFLNMFLKEKLHPAIDENSIGNFAILDKILTFSFQGDISTVDQLIRSSIWVDEEFPKLKNQFGLETTGLSFAGGRFYIISYDYSADQVRPITLDISSPELAQSSLEYNLDLIKHIAEKMVDYKFFATPKGDIIFMEPLLKFTVEDMETGYRGMYSLFDFDIRSNTFSASDANICTLLRVNGKMVPGLGDLIPLEDVLAKIVGVSTVLLEPDLLNKFGVKEQTYENPLLDAKHIPEFARSYLQRLNSNRYKSSVTIDYRPELFLPIPVLDRVNDIAGYANNITLTLTPMQDAFMTIQYEYIRPYVINSSTQKVKLAPFSVINYEALIIKNPLT